MKLLKKSKGPDLNITDPYTIKIRPIWACFIDSGKKCRNQTQFSKLKTPGWLLDSLKISEVLL